MDFKAAFDRVPRNLLWPKLKGWGVPQSLLLAIVQLHSKTWIRVKLGEGSHVSRKIETSSGVKQGCVLAPLFFNLLISDLLPILDGINCHPPQLDGVRIRNLLYANDLVLLSFPILKTTSWS